VEQLVQAEQLALLAQMEQLDHKDQQDPQVPQVRRALLVLKDQLVLLEPTAQMEQLAL
jgi:hypothetical protein